MSQLIRTTKKQTSNEVLNTYHQMLGDRKPAEQVIQEAHAHGAATTTAARVEGEHRLRHRTPILAGLGVAVVGLAGVAANEMGIRSEAEDLQMIGNKDLPAQVESGQAHDLEAPIVVTAPSAQAGSQE